MTNHPNRSSLSYPCAAPVFADADHGAEIIGQARTAAEAMAVYAAHFTGTGAQAVRAIKACPERRGQGPVDGWVPELVDE
ncbi:MAG: hypothetical protein ACHQRJ_03795 [Alphaproteobacteria bacterium]